MTPVGARAAAEGLLVACTLSTSLLFGCAGSPLGSGGGLERDAGNDAPTKEGEWRVQRRIRDLDVEIAVRSADEAVAQAAIDDAFREMERVAGLLLAGWPRSEIDILAHVPGGLWLEISPETHAAISLALRIAEETDGAYDPTWTSLLAVWGLRGPGPPHVPRDFEIDMVLRRVGFRDIEVGEDAGLQARRRSRRTELDLGALARGAALDAACQRLRALGMTAGRASTRFEHAVFGGSPSRPWRVPVIVRSTVEGTPDPAVGVAVLTDGGLAVASRGPDVPTPSGVPIHDRFDPRSGRPTRGARYAVVAGEDAASSAGLADALLAMGPDTPDFAQRHDLRAAIALPARGLWVSDRMPFEPALSAEAGASRPGQTEP